MAFSCGRTLNPLNSEMDTINYHYSSACQRVRYTRQQVNSQFLML